MNSGKVQLDVVLRGKEEVSAMLAQIAKQAKKTEADLNAVSNADITPETSGISKATAAFGNTVETVDKAEEKFNKLVGAIGFVGAAFGAVATVYTWIKSLSDSTKAVESTKVAIKGLTKTLEETYQKLVEIELRRAPSEEARKLLELEQEVNNVAALRAEVLNKAFTVEINLAVLQDKKAKLLKEMASLESIMADKSAGDLNTQLSRQAAYYSQLQNQKELKSIQAQITDGQFQLNQAKAAEIKFAQELLALENDRKRAIVESGIAKGQLIISEAVSKIKGESKKEDKKPKLPTGGTGPRAKTAAEIGEERTRERIESDARTAEAMARFDKTLAEQDAAQARLQKELSALEDMQESQAILEEEIRLFDEYTDSIYSAADAFDTLSSALGKSLDLFPEIGDGFRGVQEAMQKHAEFVKANEEQVAQGFMTSAEAVAAGEESKTKAIIGGSTEGLAAIGRLVGGLKAEYALRSAGELAMGFATLANPVESAGHFVAAGLFAVAAGKAAASGGGSGAGAAGADSEAPATSSSLGYGDGGGQRTVVYNFSTLLADRQQVHRAIRDSELVGQRNGYGRRRGV